MQHLVALIARFEKHIEQNSLLSEVLPAVYKNHQQRYKNYTIRQLCQEMHDLYVSYDVKELQKEMFRKSYFPRVVMNPQDANTEFVRGNVELVSLAKAEGPHRRRRRPCLTRLACCAWCPVKFGAAPRSVISWHWKKASTYCRDSRRNCRAFISNRMRTAGTALTATS